MSYDLDDKEMPILNEKTKNKTIKEVKLIDGLHGENYLVIVFNEGTALQINYDYIYEWDILEEHY